MNIIRIYATDFGATIEIGPIYINFALPRYWGLLRPVKVRKLHSQTHW